MLEILSLLFITLFLISGCLSTQKSNIKNGEIILIQTTFIEKLRNYLDFLQLYLSNTKGFITFYQLFISFDFDCINKVIVKQNSFYVHSYQQLRSYHKFYLAIENFNFLENKKYKFNPILIYNSSINDPTNN
jgi:hypothetical protein